MQCHENVRNWLEAQEEKDEAEAFVSPAAGGAAGAKEEFQSPSPGSPSSRL